MKDNFSNHAQDYAKFRPTYPKAVFEFLYDLLPEKLNAWDVATGNGQVAVELATKFQNVLATDLSPQQIAEAPQLKNITYRVQTSESAFDYDAKFDLITVAQAIHWFDFDKFYANVKVHLASHGIVAVIGYSVFETSGKLNEVIQHFYKNITDKYWDPERRYLDEYYQTIPFPFQEITVPKFEMEVRWTKAEFLNYLNTWSAVKHYEKANGQNPLELIKADVDANWGNAVIRKFSFPLLFRLGKNT